MQTDTLTSAPALKVKDLKIGQMVNHPKYGTMKFTGMAKRHPFTDEPAVPHRWLFDRGVDQLGRLYPVAIIRNGLETVMPIRNKPTRSERNYAFWLKINDLPHKEYIRAQSLCTKYLGGWVRGYSTTGLVIE